MICFHKWLPWSKLLEGYTGHKYQWRVCEKCGKAQVSPKMWDDQIKTAVANAAIDETKAAVPYAFDMSIHQTTHEIDPTRQKSDPIPATMDLPTHLTVEDNIKALLRHTYLLDEIEELRIMLERVSSGLSLTDVQSTSLQRLYMKYKDAMHRAYGKVTV